MKILHKIYPNVIFTSNSTSYNNIKMKNLHIIYSERQYFTAILTPHFYTKSFHYTILIAAIVICALNLKWKDKNINIRNLLSHSYFKASFLHKIFQLRINHFY